MKRRCYASMALGALLILMGTSLVLGFTAHAAVDASSPHVTATATATATSTPVVPTVTSTPVVPTMTPVPPTSTPAWTTTP